MHLHLGTPAFDFTCNLAQRGLSDSSKRGADHMKSTNLELSGRSGQEAVIIKAILEVQTFRIYWADQFLQVLRRSYHAIATLNKAPGKSVLSVKNVVVKIVKEDLPFRTILIDPFYSFLDNLQA